MTRRLTLAMKILLSKNGLNPDNWLYKSNSPEELVIVHRHTGSTRIIKK